MSFRVHGEKLLEKYKTIQIRIENLKFVEINVLSVYNDRYTKNKIRKYGCIVHTNFVV